MKQWLSMWAFVLVGLVIAGWAALSLISPSITCRGVEMGPGDVCKYASPNDPETNREQTYEERLATAQRQAPVGIIVGLGMVGFGGYLMATRKRSTEAADASEDEAEAQGSKDIGP